MELLKKLETLKFELVGKVFEYYVFKTQAFFDFDGSPTSIPSTVLNIRNPKGENLGYLIFRKNGENKYGKPHYYGETFTPTNAKKTSPLRDKKMIQLLLYHFAEEPIYITKVSYKD